MRTLDVECFEDGERERPALVWRFDPAALAISSAPLGGGIGLRHWVVNAQVPLDYARTDLEAHLGAIARALGCDGPGVGFLTAAPVEAFFTGRDGDVDAYATVGLRHPTWAADAEGAVGGLPLGTINLLVGVPVPLEPGALVNAVTTATEAKSQALIEHGVPATGTASDAICVACPADGAAEAFAGPRAPVGSRIARAVHSAVSAGAAAGWPPDGTVAS
jgi:adenosylcobinamide amidohydrolase